MFLDDLIEFISADASVNSLVTGGIVFPHLPTDFDSSKDWIVFEFSLIESIRVQGDKSAMEKYELSLQVVSKDIEAVETIAGTLDNYVITYPNDWGIDAYPTANSKPDFDTTTEVYYKTLKYNILY
jgi:hypothetical protein